MQRLDLSAVYAWPPATDYETEKLREYQIKRMKYYYAVVECDSKDTASHLYDQCDGLEFETSANKLDLRWAINTAWLFITYVLIIIIAAFFNSCTAIASSRGWVTLV